MARDRAQDLRGSQGLIGSCGHVVGSSDDTLQIEVLYRMLHCATLQALCPSRCDLLALLRPLPLYSGGHHATERCKHTRGQEDFGESFYSNVQHLRKQVWCHKLAERCDSRVDHRCDVNPVNLSDAGEEFVLVDGLGDRDPDCCSEGLSKDGDL